MAWRVDRKNVRDVDQLSIRIQTKLFMSMLNFSKYLGIF
jgi:hypothetical protein